MLVIRGNIFLAHSAYDFYSDFVRFLCVAHFIDTRRSS